MKAPTPYKHPLASKISFPCLMSTDHSISAENMAFYPSSRFLSWLLSLTASETNVYIEPPMALVKMETGSLGTVKPF